MGDTMVQDLIRRLNDWLRVLPPGQERITKLIDDLQARFGERADPVTATVCREIEAAAWAYSRHSLTAAQASPADLLAYVRAH